MRIWRFFVQMILVILVLGSAGFSAFYLYKTRPQVAPTPPQERVWQVSTDKVEITDIQPQLRLYGNVVAGRTVELRALVAGEIMGVGPSFRDGGAVQAGDMIAQIDDFDYRTTLLERRSQVTEAKARIDEIEVRRKSHRDALKQDRDILALQKRHLARVERLKAKGAGTDRALDNAKLDLTRQLQIMSNRQNEITAETARLRQQQALIERLNVGIARIERDLERTKLTAPFDGYLYEISAEIGKRVSLNDRIARLIDAGRLEVAVHLSDSQFGRLISEGETLNGRKAKIIWRIGGRDLVFDAKIERGAATINAASGGVDVFARIEKAALEQALRPGAFVTVLLADRTYPAVARLPESAIDNLGQVYVVVEGRLERRKIELIARQGNDALVRGEIANGEEVVRHLFGEIGPGVKVETR
jgi:membrane fusion protein, multidrug efflux system